MSAYGRIQFDQAALKRLLDSPSGPVAKALVKRALVAHATAKQLCPVDTGRLRSSIAWRMESDSRGLVAVIGTDVEYAPFIEFGTRNMRAQPYLRPALAAAVRA